MIVLISVDICSKVQNGKKIHKTEPPDQAFKVFCYSALIQLKIVA